MLRKIATMAISVLLCLTIIVAPQGALADVQAYQAKEVIQSAVYLFNQTGITTQTSKAVLIEMFTATWCVVCAVAEPAIDDLSVEYGSEVAVLEYHPYPDTSGDILGIPEGNARMNGYYGADTFPTVMFDGVIKKVGAVDLDEDLHTTYGNYIESRLGGNPPISINLSGTIGGTSDHVNATFKTAGYFSNTLTARFVLFEDDIFYDYPGSNGITDHRFVVRKILDEDYITINVTTSFSVRKDFSVDSGWNASKMGLVAFVQSDNGVRYASSLGGLIQGEDQIGVLIVLIMVSTILAILFIGYIWRKKKKPSTKNQKEQG